MLNQIVLMGRLVRDAETRFLNGEQPSSVTRFTLAVDRDYKVNGEDKADFINCIAWNKTGEFIEKYFHKGSLIAVTGSLETGSYTNKDGQKVYTTEVRVSKASFTGEKKAEATETTETAPSDTEFMSIPEGVIEELPFT